MIETRKNVEIFRDSDSKKMVINKKGQILGMSNSFKKLFCYNAPETIFELFEHDLYSKVNTLLDNPQNPNSLIKDAISGNIRVNGTSYTTLYIIYQPVSEKAIITLKIHEQSPTNIDRVYSNAFRYSDSSLMLIDHKSEVYEVNEKFLQMFNVEKSNVVGKPVSSIVSGLESVGNFQLDSYWKQVCEEHYAEAPFRYKMNDGTVKYLQLNTRYDIESRMFVVKLKDTTEKELLLEQLAHSDTLSTVGEIAASIAHEVRNPMTTLKGFLQLLEYEVSGNALNYLKVIQNEVERMNEILNEMLALSKPTLDQVTVFSLSVLVEDVLRLLRPKALLDQITIVSKQIENDHALVRANPNRMKQVLVNLFKNSMEAMTPGGMLSVELTLNGDSQIRLYVSDTGCGIAEDVLDSIFVPFVSLKEGGTGLGLPFVWKTVTEYGGTIDVQSSVGVGTVFELAFPRVCVSTLEPGELQVIQVPVS